MVKNSQVFQEAWNILSLDYAGAWKGDSWELNLCIWNFGLLTEKDKIIRSGLLVSLELNISGI
jgi:hypothetical protein